MPRIDSEKPSRRTIVLFLVDDSGFGMNIGVRRQHVLPNSETLTRWQKVSMRFQRPGNAEPAVFAARRGPVIQVGSNSPLRHGITQWIGAASETILIATTTVDPE